ncbi:MAG: dTDP-4-dehydrorhamnose 3,5-epimerase [Elusimicrobiales bacterium]|nr:dTDP-4-dehydrorhamnose 3,5-epimerase [Elusimicrobiales bacterium]
MPFKFENLAIPGIILITPKFFPDNRGAFGETYKRSEFAGHGIQESFVQDNQSVSEKGVLRGLHYQKNPKAQGKLIRCLLGKILDIAVDIRRGSPSFGKWVGLILDGESAKMLYVPPGFAHGFLALTKSMVLYKTTAEYAPDCERGIIWNDPAIAVDWRIKNPALAAKDMLHPLLKDSDNNFDFK